jgi:membrane fusion protein
MSSKSLFRPEAVSHGARRLAGEVVLASPLPTKLIGLLLAAIVIAAAVFAGLATYARTESLSGWLVPDRGLIRAAAPSTGIIQKVLVTEGDVVPEGHRLAEITLAAETAEGNSGEGRAIGLRQEAAAVKARKAAAIARLEAEAAQAKVRIDNFGHELSEIEAQIALQEHRRKLSQRQANAAEQLASRGTVSARDLEQRQSAVLSIELERVGLRRQAEALKRDISESTARLASIPIEIEAAQADSLSAEANLKQKTSDSEAHRAIFVLAPMGGRVAALPVSGGQPVSTGATLAVITPADGLLEAELLAPSRAIGFIRPGQEVHLQLQAFPYQRFGTLKGKVKSVSGTVIGPSDVSIPGLPVHEPVFRVRVSLASTEMVAYGQSHVLQPGMLLKAEVVLDRQNLIRWLFDPLYAVSRKS